MDPQSTIELHDTFLFEYSYMIDLSIPYEINHTWEVSTSEFHETCTYVGYGKVKTNMKY